MGARRLRRALGVGVVLAPVLVLLLVDLRHHDSDTPPRLLRHQEGRGQLLVGAGVSDIVVPYPVVAAGYGPKDRHTVTSAKQPQQAQAISLAVGDARLTIVSVDLLEVDSKLPTELRPRLPNDAGEVWLCATHTHSGMGNYDPNLLAQLAGTGRFHADARAALGDAIVKAVEQSVGNRIPTSMSLEQVEATFAVNRDDARERVTEPLSVLSFPEAHAQLLAVPGHPTLVPRATPTLDADFPGIRIARNTSTMWLQAAAGDLAIDRGWRMDGSTLGEAALHALTSGHAIAASRLETATVALGLPPVEVHAAPELLRTAASTLVDRLAAPRTAQLSIARFGELTLIAVPGEPTQRSGGALRIAVGDPHAVVLGLCNGYVGYIETSARVVLGSGETKRQEFDASLLDRFTTAARLAGSAVGNAAPPPSPAASRQ